MPKSNCSGRDVKVVLGKSTRFCWRITFAMLFLSSARYTYAIDFPDIFADPLLVRPPLITIGATLPGDTAPVSCTGNIDVTQALALGEAVDLALCNNAQVKVAWAAIKIQAAALGEAHAPYWPTISSSLSGLNSRTVTSGLAASTSSNTGRTMYGNFNWRLFDFGGRAANKEAAAQLLFAALLDHDAALQRILTSVIEAYFEAITAESFLTARSKAVDIAQTTLVNTQNRESKGVAPISDTLQATTALAKAKLGKRRAEGDYRKSISVLIYAMGLPAATKLALPVEADTPYPEMVADLAQWLTDAEERHPSIKASRAQLSAAVAKVDGARAEGLPSIDFVANYYQNGFPNQGLSSSRTQTSTVGFTLSIPIFEGFARTYKIRGAQAQVERSEAQLQDIQYQVLAEVVKTHAEAEAFLGNLQLSEELLKAAQQSTDTSARRYARGVAEIQEVLNTQSALADAELERIRSLSEWRSARLRLMSRAGLMGRHAL